jgi:REP element-mobilizing transposase RayT
MAWIACFDMAWLAEEKRHKQYANHKQRLQVMGCLKGKSAMMIFERHSNLKHKFGNRNFWATGYYVSTVG